MNFNLPIESKVTCTVNLKNDKHEELKVTGEWYTVVKVCKLKNKFDRCVSRDLLKVKMDLYTSDDSLKTIYNNPSEEISSEYCTEYFSKYPYSYISSFVYEGNNYTEYRQLFLERLIRDPEYYYIIHEKYKFDLDNISLKDIQVYPEVEKYKVEVWRWSHLYYQVIVYAYNNKQDDSALKSTAHREGYGNYKSRADLVNFIKNINGYGNESTVYTEQLECEPRPLYY